MNKYYKKRKEELREAILDVISIERDIEYDSIEYANVKIAEEDKKHPESKEVKKSIRKGQRKFNKIALNVIDEVREILTEYE